MGFPIKEFVKAATPSRVLRMPFEAAQAGLDTACLINPLSMTFLYANTPNGNGKPVLILPGLGGTKETLLPLHYLLRSRGYRTYDWKQGINFGRSGAPLQNILEVAEGIYNKTGQKLTIVGHSMGGVMGQCVTSLNPEIVDKVITLGSPINYQGDPKVLDVVIGLMQEHRLAEEGSRGDIKHLLESFRKAKTEFGIPTTHIYTRRDRIIGSNGGFASKITNETDNIEIYSSHIAMGYNASALHAVGQKLALPESEQEPFDFRAYPAFMPQTPLHLQGDRSVYVHGYPDEGVVPAQKQNGADVIIFEIAKEA